MPYDDVIRRVAKKYGVDPALLWGVVKTESNFNPNAVSKVGAIGLGQLMPATAAQYGVDPHDPEQNLEGAAQHLAYLTKRFNGDTKKVLAAYNAGEGRVSRGGELPAETRAYVPKVLANAKGYQPMEDVGHIDDEQLRLAYEMGKQQRQQHKDDEAALRAAYEKYHPAESGGAAIVEGSARRSGPSVGAIAGGVLGGIGGAVIGGTAGAAGGLPGIVAGGTAGAIRGGQIGAVVGTGVGELAQQQYDRMTNSAYAPHSFEDAASRVGVEMGAAAVGEAIPAGFRLLRPISYARPRALTPEQQQTKAVLDRYGIRYTPDQITGNIFHNFARSLADSGVLSQNTMKKALTDHYATVREAAHGIADTMGQHVPMNVLGDRTRALIRDEDKAVTEGVIDVMYNSIATALDFEQKKVATQTGRRVPLGIGGMTVPETAEKVVESGGLLVDQRPIKSLFAKEVAEIEKAAINQNDPSLLKSPAYLSMKRAADMPEYGQWTAAHRVLKKVREDLRSLDNPLDVASATLNDRRALTALEKKLDEQMGLALEQSANPEHQALYKTWQDAQRAVAERNEQFRNEVILRMTKAIDEHGGEAGMKQFVSSMTPDDMLKVMNATKSDPALQGSLRQGWLSTKIEKVGGLDDPKAPFDIEKLRREVFGRTGLDKRKAEVLFTPIQRQKLNEFINAVSDVQSAPGSQLGKYLMLQNGGAMFSIPTAAAGALGVGGIYAAGAGDTTKATAELGGSITIVVTPWVLSKMLTNPRAVEYMIQGLRYSALDHSNTARITRQLMSLDENFARAVQAGISAYNAEQTSGPLHKTAETVSKRIHSTLPQFGLGQFQP